jgi:hypothetical protein
MYSEGKLKSIDSFGFGFCGGENVDYSFLSCDGISVIGGYHCHGGKYRLHFQGRWGRVRIRRWKSCVPLK